jgi:hypothetical protein
MNFKQYLTEVGRTLVKPIINSINVKGDRLKSTANITVDGKNYIVGMYNFGTYSKELDEFIYELDVDFHLEGDKVSKNYELTNFGNPLKVVGAVIYTMIEMLRKLPVKERESYVRSIEFEALEEHYDDKRRERLYLKFIENYFKTKNLDFSIEPKKEVGGTTLIKFKNAQIKDLI